MDGHTGHKLHSKCSFTDCTWQQSEWEKKLQ